MTLYVEKGWSIHFHFRFAPAGHFANMYGFKSEDGAVNVAKQIPGVDEVYIECRWKNKKFGPWCSERMTVSEESEQRR